MVNRLISFVTILLALTSFATPLVLRHRRHTNNTTNITQPNTSYQPTYISAENTGHEVSRGSAFPPSKDLDGTILKDVGSPSKGAEFASAGGPMAEHVGGKMRGGVARLKTLKGNEAN